MLASGRNKMHRRELLKLAPLAALAVLPINVNGAQPQAYEVKSEKKYVFMFGPDVDEKYLNTFADCAKAAGIKGIAIVGQPDVTIYEVDAA
jgi:hypothetical protein